MNSIPTFEDLGRIFVITRGNIDLGAAFQQKSDNVQIPGLNSEKQGCPAIIRISDTRRGVNVGSSFIQQREHVQIFTLDSQRKRCIAIIIREIDVSMVVQ